MAGPEEKPERDSRGHGYSWRDLVQRICNLHFKHTLKSVPGRQPKSALTLVAGGPCWCSSTFSFKTECMRTHTYIQTHTPRATAHKSPDLPVFIALSSDWPLSFLSLALFLCFVWVSLWMTPASHGAFLYGGKKTRSHPGSWRRRLEGRASAYLYCRQSGMSGAVEGGLWGPWVNTQPKVCANKC